MPLEELIIRMEKHILGKLKIFYHMDLDKKMNQINQSTLEYLIRELKSLLE